MAMHGEYLVNIVEFFRMDKNNVGDWYSNPCRYFFTDRNTTQIDIDNVRKTTWEQSDALIVGGGGLIGNSNFETLMKRISTHPDELLLTDILETKIKSVSSENRSIIHKWKTRVQQDTIEVLSRLDRSFGPRILWGAGYNTRDSDEDSYTASYPNYLNQYHLVGIRDWESDYRWVPCASCMHPAFDREYKITNEIVWFEHKKRLLDNKCFDALPAPRMINSGQNLEQILEFLGSAETVITNSYHGVYWATLLRRKVVCIPWGSKFNMFKHPPTFATETNWVEKIEEAQVYQSALVECRQANIDFYEEVKKIIPCT